MTHFVQICIKLSKFFKVKVTARSAEYLKYCGRILVKFGVPMFIKLRKFFWKVRVKGQGHSKINRISPKVMDDKFCTDTYLLSRTVIFFLFVFS